MQFDKKINNNVALVKDDHHEEYIIVGKGVGFGKKKGDLIVEKDITRRFFPDERNSMNSIIQHFMNLQPEIVSMVTDVSKMAEKELGIKFSNNHYIILADHINFAIARMEEGIEYNDSNRWEVRKLYPKEYRAAVQAIDLIYDKWGVRLTKSEEVFITYHFVNAQNKNHTIKETFKLTDLMGEALKLIEEHFQMELDDEEFNYIRMTNHLKYFFIRKMHCEAIQSDDHSLADSVKAQCIEESKVVDEICDMLRKREHWEISADEQMFLTLHIWRINVGQKSK